jgi:hypothetical protein
MNMVTKSAETIPLRFCAKCCAQVHPIEWREVHSIAVTLVGLSTKTNGVSGKIAFIGSVAGGNQPHLTAREDPFWQVLAYVRRAHTTS